MLEKIVNYEKITKKFHRKKMPKETVKIEKMSDKVVKVLKN